MDDAASRDAVSLDVDMILRGDFSGILDKGKVLAINDKHRVVESSMIVTTSALIFIIFIARNVFSILVVF